MVQDRTERQKEGVRKWISSGCRSTLCWATGVGKTRGAIMAVQAFLSKDKNKNKIIKVIVPTENLKIQWIQVLISFKLHNYVEVEIINSAIKKDTKIDFLILDEVHRTAAESFLDVFRMRNPTLVLGLSATFSRLDGRHDLLKKYCPIIDVIEIDEAIENGWLSPYKEYKVMIDPDDIDVYKEVNKTFLETFGFFNHDFKLAMECVSGRRHRNKVVVPSHKIRYDYAKSLCTLDTWDPRYYDLVKSINSEVSANCFSWNRALQDRKSYIMNHPTKIELAKKILNYRPDSKAITFSATIKQAEKIKQGYIVHSGKTKRKNRLTMEEFSKLDAGVINTSKSLDEGADISGLNLAIVLCNSSSKTQKTQRVGRVIRYEKDKIAEVFTLVLKGTVEENWYNTSTAGKDYIEIDESELDKILKGEKINEFKQEAKKADLIFRL